MENSFNEWMEIISKCYGTMNLNNVVKLSKVHGFKVLIWNLVVSEIKPHSADKFLLSFCSWFAF